MKAIVLALLFLAMLGDASGQTSSCPQTPSCDPLTVKDRTKCGAELKGTTATGQWRAFWFPSSTAPNVWMWCGFQWAMLDKYAPSDPHAVVAIVDSLMDAPDVPSAIMDALTRSSIKPPVGSQDEFDFKMLHFAACQALRASPPVTPWITPPEPCVAPTPPQSAWKAIGSWIFTYAGGKLTGVTARKATAGAACDGVTKATVGPTVYQSLVGGPASEVTGCTK